MRLPHCGGEVDSQQLPTLTSTTVPLYPNMRFHFPSLIGTLSWAWREGITHVELATPGPMGLVGLLVAKVLRLPVTATYHTELPGLVRALGGPAFLERASRSYLSWFYNRVDRVFAFSEGSRDTLINLGVAPASVARMPIAVDPDEFSPAHRSRAVFDQLNLEVGDRPVILTVGRLSEEKNIPVIVEAVGKLQGRQAPPVLVIVGDGPEGPALRERYGGVEFVRFAGFRQGETLRKLYASATAFVFASLIDTLGIVNMEAMASGVPVLLPTKACAAEIVADGLSGECYEFGVDGLAGALGRVLDDPSLATAIGVTGRRTMVQRWQRASFPDVWAAYTQARPLCTARVSHTAHCPGEHDASHDRHPAVRGAVHLVQDVAVHAVGAGRHRSIRVVVSVVPDVE